MFGNVYKKQWKYIIEKKLTAISETETFVISKTQMTPKKQLTMKLLRSKWYIEQKVPKYQIQTSNAYPMILISQLTGKKYVIEDALIGLQIQQFSP